VSSVTVSAANGDWRLALSEPRRRRLRLWILAIAATTASVLVVGGITRLTHSGLSIVEWQPLVGVVPPLGDSQWVERFEQYRRFPEYQQLRREMTLGEFKWIFFWEYLHRLLARGIGVVFLVPCVAFWRAGYFTRPLARRVLALFGLGAAQGALGWFMVRSGLVDRPSVSHYRLAAHLMLAFVIFGYCVWLARDLAATRPRGPVDAHGRHLVARGLGLVGGLLAAQLIWGAFVAGLKAGLLHNTFPLMGGRLVPVTLLAQEPALLNFVENVTAVQWTHRVLGSALLAATALLWLLVRRMSADRTSRRASGALAVVTAAQYLLGVATLLTGVRIGLAVAHQALALALVGVWVAWVHHVHAAAAPARSSIRRDRQTLPGGVTAQAASRR
jgi:cytochrome c oxidase assembly protein subunit 15